MSKQAELIDTIVSQYVKRFPDERTKLAALIEQVANEDVLDNPKTLPGHVTGGAFVLSPEKAKLLLIHHKFLNKWLQPGGHWDPGESDPQAAAKREAEEETAVLIAKYLPVDSNFPLIPFDIDSHEIPERPEKDMPAHLHHDFRYVFLAESLQLSGLESEIHEAGWFDFADPKCENVAGIVQKMSDLGFIKL